MFMTLPLCFLAWAHPYQNFPARPRPHHFPSLLYSVGAQGAIAGSPEQEWKGLTSAGTRQPVSSAWSRNSYLKGFELGNTVHALVRMVALNKAPEGM